jgi:limonene-1,2-epoxide hydrolase
MFNLDKFFEVTDSMDSTGFSSFFKDDATWTIGNQNPCAGKEQIQAAADGFFSNLKGIKHTISDTAVKENMIFFDGKVEYHKLDDTKVSVPFSCKIKLENEKILSYQTYFDASPFFD